MKSEAILNGAVLPESISNGAVSRDAMQAATAAGPAQLDLWQHALSLWQRILRLSRRAPRRLRLCESLPLGERRFVAVVEFEESRFLVGGTSASLVLLARLENAASQVPSSLARERSEISGEEQR